MEYYIEKCINGWRVACLIDGEVWPRYLMRRYKNRYTWSLDYAHAKTYTHATARRILWRLSTDSGVPK